jgi:hypothetical protein
MATRGAKGKTVVSGRLRCCMAPGQRHLVPAAEHRPDRRQHRWLADRRRYGGHHQVDGAYQPSIGVRLAPARS